MNFSEENTRSEKNNHTLGGVGQNSAKNPSSVSCSGFRNGKPLFPCSVVPSEYPACLVPESPLPTIPNRRLDFAMSYYRTHFWKYCGYGEKRTKGTPTELQHSRIPQSSCERRGVFNDPQEGEDPTLDKVCDKEVGGRDSYSQRSVSSTAQLAQSNKVDEATQCDRSLEDADLERPPDSSSEEGKGTGEESVLGRDLDGEEEGERDSYNKVDEATQCDRSLEDADLERSPDSSSEGGKGTGEESVLGRDLDGEEEGERDSYNKVDEATQCDRSLEDADLLRSPDSSEGGKGTGEESVLGRDLDGEEVGERDSYNKVDEATQCDRSLEDADLERSPDSSEGGKGTGEELVLGRDLDGEEVGERDSYYKVDEVTQCDRSLEDADLERSPEQMAYLNINPSRDLVLFNNCELEDKAREVQWVFEEVSGPSSEEVSGPSFIERFYHEACRATRLLASSFYPQLVWPSSNKTDNNKHAADENIPPISMLARKQDSEISSSKFQTECMTAQEGLEPMASSPESLEWNETHY